MLYRLLHILTGRVTRNICFWAICLYMRFQYVDYVYTPMELAFCLGILCMFWVLLYLNNLVLIPKLLARKKIVFYFMAVLPLIWLYSFTSASVVFLVRKHFQEIPIFKIVWWPIANDDLSNHDEFIAANVVFSSVMVLVFSLCWYAMNFAQKAKELKHLKKLQSDTELHFLKNQLNPHFLFNTLNNIYGLSLKSPEDTPELILKLSTLLRYLLYESNADKVSFRKEMELMAAFTELEVLRFPENEVFGFSVSCDREDYLVPPLLWLPMLENIFKYGISNDINMMFECTITDNVMHIRSENSYTPEAVTARKGSHHGVGLDNLRKRLNLLYNGQYKINITEAEQRFIIDILINLR